MLLHWYDCISLNSNWYVMYYISLETVWWVLSKASYIMQKYPAIPKITANETF